MSDSSEELLNKHRKERRDLQNQIQSLKKSCAKGDKKRKKEILDEIVRLELELDQKHAKELEETEQVNNSDITNDDLHEEEEEEPIIIKEGRISKAQKRRDKKAAQEKEREERIINQEIKNKSGPRNKEIEKIKCILKESGLEIYNIPADGNCLYCAVEHQLRVTGRQSYSISELRKLTADHMRSHRDDFFPFMTHNDEDKEFTEDMYEQYCDALVKKPIWGGQVEIRALSNVLQCPIRVVQANSGCTVQGEQFTGPPLVLSYHRHLYRLGEHYNSTVTAAPPEQDF